MKAKKFNNIRSLLYPKRKPLRKSTIVIIIGIVGISWFISVNLVIPRYSALTTIEYAMGVLARAETAQTPNEVIYHVTAAKDILPEIGPVSWWSPEKGDFKNIQAELDDIIIRARSISTLNADDEFFNSELFDIHEKLQDIQETLLAF